MNNNVEDSESGASATGIISEDTNHRGGDADDSLTTSNYSSSQLPPKKRSKKEETPQEPATEEPVVKEGSKEDEESSSPPPLPPPNQYDDANNLLSLGTSGAPQPPQFNPAGLGLGYAAFGGGGMHGLPGQMAYPPNHHPSFNHHLYGSYPPPPGLYYPQGGNGGQVGGGGAHQPIMYHPQMPPHHGAPMYGGQALLQSVVSTDSQTDVNNNNTNQVAVASAASTVPVEAKKWARWSDNEDQMLRSAVEQSGDNNWDYISKHVFGGSRSDKQCKNRWKKSLQPGLVKGHWTKEEDDRIVAFASSGNEDEKGNKKWSELRLPGRVGEQVKARWENILDPSIKKGAWTEDEMAILRSAQKELGNKWAEIAKRISGRNESSVKNRWYNVRTSKKKAEQKKKKSKNRQLEEALEVEHEEELLDTKVPALSPVKKKEEVSNVSDV